ncbi:MAG: hypothetical protein JW940_21175 [Polyangiaceae bacterium]|nr:hypothetical protein [Polyangiaceae bacterium]
MRILVWATTLQADILALALSLDQRDDIELMVVAEGLSAYLRQPIAAVRPMRAAMHERDEDATRHAVERFRADIVVCDNHFPAFAAAPRVCSLWHGLGWKARPGADIRTYCRAVERLTGIDPTKPNPRFLAQCYAEPDRLWRTEQWGLAPENCRTIGMAFSDLLKSPPYGKEDLASYYELDIGARKNVLVNVTWHYGRFVPGTWKPGLLAAPFDSDIQFFDALFSRAHDHGANVLLCMHDRKRYEARYLTAIRALARRFGRVAIRHKDEFPDNLTDLLVADAMVSNLSSFVTFMYVLGKPTVHICPPPNARVRFTRFHRSRLRARGADDQPPWMNDPSDNGGLSAFDDDGALTALDRALAEPDCCRERAHAWVGRHVWRPDGHTCERLQQALRALGEVA